MARGKAKGRGALRIRRQDSAFVARSAQSHGLVIARAEGSFVFDAEGRRFIDLVMGSGVGILGWRRPEIVERLRSFEGPDYVHPSFVYAPWVELARRLGELAPGRLRKAWRATGGTEAVEIALQIALAATGRRALVSIAGAYHGNAIGSVSIGAEENRDSLKNLLPRCHRLRPPLVEARLDQVERLLKTKEVAAVILEPVIINLAVQLPEVAFLRGLRRLCDRYGTLLIFDEVMTGFGRTGRLFASEHSGVVPDILCLAKGLSAGHAAIGATLTTPALAAAIEGKVGFHSTYGWHPRSVEAALATLEVFDREGEALLENVEARSRDFALGLAQLPFREDPTVRIQGLAIALEFEDDRYPQRVAQRCRDNGLLVSAEENVITLLPALNLDAATLREGLECLRASV